jgi:MutS domain V
MRNYSMSPTQQYSARLADREKSQAHLDGVHARIGSIRLVIGASFLIMAWLCFGPIALNAWWLCIPVLGFVGVLIYHQRIRSLRTQAHRAVLLYRAALARIEDKWGGTGSTGARFDVRHHIYGDDLDLFGNDSLFQLLCAARTQRGEDTLANWLLAPAEIEVIRARHLSIADLRERLDFQETLAISGESLKIDLHPDTLAAWAAAPNRLARAWIRWSAPLLAGLAIAGAVAWAVSGIVFPLLAVITFELLLSYYLREPIRTAIASVETAYEDLKLLSLLLKLIEAQRFAATPLEALQVKLGSHSLRASVAISRLATIVNFVEARRNPILAPLLLLLMYPLQTAMTAERWRSAHGAKIPSWLDALAEIEALLSLARYAYEHPEDPLPEFVDGPAAFTAVALGHPLLPADVRVTNNVDVSADARVLLVSGSNMSGKSTLLRTVGINTVLAMAGAPVRAQRIRMTPLQIGASIRINDSLHEGSSRFYAEITRLRQLFEPTTLPLLFLLDELLQGTNSADRRVGAQGLIRALIRKGAIGLVSTHDLALTDIAGLDPDALVNVHFQDEFVDGKLIFDFKLHPGIVTKSNGIALMRSIGLDV